MLFSTISRKPAAPPQTWHLGDGPPPLGPHTALLPGAEIAMVPLDLPPAIKGNARRRVALRALQEKLSTPEAETEVHFCSFGSQISHAVILSKQNAESWRATLAPDSCLSAIPDYLALPYNPGIWTIQNRGNAISARLDDGSGFTAETLLAASLFTRAPAPRAILCLGPLPEDLQAVINKAGVPVFSDQDSLRAAGFVGRGLRRHDTGGVCLRHPPDSTAPRPVLPRFTPAAAMATMALVLWSAALALETRELSVQTKAIRDDTEALVRRHFLPSGPLLDLKAQIERAIASKIGTETATPPSPLVLLQSSGRFFTAPGISLEAVSYSDATGLEATLHAESFQSVDAIMNALHKAGFKTKHRTGLEPTGTIIAAIQVGPPSE